MGRGAGREFTARGRALALRVVAATPPSTRSVFNPWRDRCRHDTAENGPEARVARLAAHFSLVRAGFLLVGEAPGYQGARHSGIAFSSEALLLDGAIARVAQPGERLTKRERPFREPSATLVWRELYRLDIADTTLLWNAYPCHPHRIGEPWSNRTPTDSEIEHGLPALRLIARAHPRARIVAVGRKAQSLLAAGGISVAGAVRHPARGGAREFAEGLAAIVARRSS